jgi:hypothetical protein
VVGSVVVDAVVLELPEALESGYEALLVLLLESGEAPSAVVLVLVLPLVLAVVSSGAVSFCAHAASANATAAATVSERSLSMKSPCMRKLRAAVPAYAIPEVFSGRPNATSMRHHGTTDVCSRPSSRTYSPGAIPMSALNSRDRCA